MATAMAGNGNGTAIASPASDREMTYVPFGSKESIKLSVKIIQTMVCVPSRSGKVCSDIEAMKFMMLCKARACNPFEGDCFLLGYDSEDGKTATFSFITSHQTFLKRAEVHPEFDGMESGVMVRDQGGNIIDREGDFFFDEDFILGGWATVHFKNRKHAMRKRVALKTFHTGKSRWKKDPAGMIVKVAEADALRSAFPTMLGGLYVDGEMPLQFVNDPAPASKPEIPLGRTKIKDVRPATPTAPVNKDADEPIDAEEAPTEPSVPPPQADSPKFDQDAADSLRVDLSKRMSEAMSITMTNKIGEEIGQKMAILGTTNFDELMAEFRAKSAEILSKKK